MLSHSRICPRPLRATVASLLCFVLLIQTSGCASWQTLEPSAPVSRIQSPVRLELVDGRVFLADSVRVLNDSLLLLLPNWALERPGRDSTASDTIPVTLVSKVQVYRIGYDATIAIVAVVVAIVGGLIYGLSQMKFGLGSGSY